MKSLLFASHRLCLISGIPVRVSYFLYVMVGAVVIVQAPRFAGDQRLCIIAGVAMFPLFVLVHELSHAIMAQREGIQVNGILLHAIGGVAELQGLMRGPGSEIRIALAGPAVNSALAACLFLALAFLGEPGLLANLAGSNGALPAVVTALLFDNLALALFNCLPIFPMDGGRVAAAIAVMLVGPAAGVLAMGRIAFAGVALLAGAGIWLIALDMIRPGLALILIGSFLYTTGKQELQARLFASRYADIAPPRPGPAEMAPAQFLPLMEAGGIPAEEGEG